MRLIKVVFFLALIYQLPLSAQEKFSEAEKLFFARNYEAALPLLLATIEEQPEHAQAYSYIGDIFLLQKEYRQALNWYEKALQYSKEPGKEKYRIGQAYQESGNIDSALEAYMSAYSLDPQLHAALFQTGYLQLVYKRDKQKVIFYWRTFLQAAPDDPQAPKIEEVLKILENPDFELPPPDSDISLEEALKFGGKMVQPKKVETKTESQGYEDDREKNELQTLPDEEEGLD